MIKNLSLLNINNYKYSQNKKYYECLIDSDDYNIK